MKTSYRRYLAIAAALVWTVVPIYWFIKMAFVTPAEIVYFPPRLFPQELQPAALYNVLGFDYVTESGTLFGASGQAKQVIFGIRNSFIISVAVTVITMLVVFPLAYVFGRLNFPHKTKLLFAILLAVALPPISTLIPFYIMFIQLDLDGTLFGMVLVILTITIPFVTWMMIGYARNLPPIEPLARIDGFSRVETFIRIIVPMARSGIAVGAAISFLFAWNEYAFASVLVNGTNANTLSTAISGFLFMWPEPSHLAAAVFYSLIPPFIVCYWLQRHIAEMNIVETLR